MPGHILVVEDSPLVQRLVQVCLRDIGRPVLGAEDGPSGLQALLDDPPALLILDIGLPGMDGWEVLRRIREHPEVRRLPVLILTAHAQEETRREADRRGADAFMTKPFEPDALRESVGHLLVEAGRRTMAAPAPHAP